MPRPLHPHPQILKPGSSWQDCEAALDARNNSLPLFHRVIWAHALASSGGETFFVPIKGADDCCEAGFAFESKPSRALPGHRRLSIRRLGVGAGGLREASLDAALTVLGELCARDKSILQVTAEVFALDAKDRATTTRALLCHGFVKVPATLTYERTLVVDLRLTEDALLANFHKNARQGIRNISRFPLALTTADSISLAPRLSELSEETRHRTGGETRDLDWRSLIAMSLEAPHLSRIAVLRRTDMSDAKGVIAFAWGCVHGNVAEYGESGSARVDDMKVSTSYALLWDLMRWGRGSGASWFDMGGITSGTTHSSDPLGGISDFKRRFSQHELEVGEQWQFEPHPARVAAAQVVSSGIGALRHATRWLKRR